MWAIVLVLLSAAANAAALVLLRKATEAEEDRPKFSLPLLWLLVRRRPVWGAGIATIVVGFVLQALALANGPLSVVQLVILMELPFTLILAWPVLGGRLQAREWSAIAAMPAGLVVVLFSLAPTGGNPFSPDLLTWLIGLAVTVAVVLVLLGLGRRNSPAVRTALFGAAIAGFLALQNALQAGRLAASQPGVTLANPAVALVWGIGLFHEQIQTGWRLVGAGLGAALLVGGAVLLSRSPLLDSQQQGSERDP